MEHTLHIRKSRHDTMSGIPDELYFLRLPQWVGYQDQGINVTDTEISNMIQEADLNTDQEFSVYAVDSEVFSIMLFKMRMWHILQIIGSRAKTHFLQLFVLQIYLVDFQRSLYFCIFQWSFTQN